MRVDLYKQGGYGGGGMTQNGGNISGPLVLAGNPSQTLEAVPKQYVDAYFSSITANNFSTGTLNSARLPALTGDLSSTQGSSVVTLSSTGVVAGSHSKITVNNKGRVLAGGVLGNSDLPSGINWNKVTTGKPTTLSGYGITDGVNLSGGSLTGFLTVNTPPVTGLHLVNKSYVSALVSSGGVSVGDVIRKPFNGTPTGFLRCNGASLDKTTYADLYAVIGDSYNNTCQAGSGQPWQQQYQINDSQSTDITGWTTGTSLPQVVYGFATIVTKNRVYMIGGNNITVAINTVYTAVINTDGTLGAWTTGTATPFTIGYSSTIVIKNRVYIIGGWSSGSYPGLIYTATINSDGILGTWSTYGSFPVGLHNTTVAVTKNRVYIFGGNNGSVNVQTVYSAPISSDGFIGVWVQEASLLNGVVVTGTAVTKNRIYVFCDIINSIYKSNIFTAAINSDGTLGNYTSITGLPAPAASAQIITTRYRVYVIGGYNGSAYVSTVYTAPINTDGTLGTWSTGTAMPGSLRSGYASAIAIKNRVYMLGGYNGSAYSATVYTAPISGGASDLSPYYSDDTDNYMTIGSGKPWNQQYQINTTQTNDITGWTTSGSLLQAAYAAAAVVTKSRVYLLGGWINSSLNTTQSAAINSDGTLGTWTAGVSLPGGYSYGGHVVTKNRIYLMGGYSAGSSSSSSAVYTAPINSDGTIGAWVTSSPLPVAMSGFTTIVTNSKVYIIGGWTTAAISTIYVANILTDGTIGGWLVTSSLPGVLAYSQSIVTKNRVYVIGGYNGAYTNIVYTASISDDGVIGTWTTGPSLPGVLAESQLFVSRNKVYMLGGYSSAVTSITYNAPINSDGTLGAWVTGTSLSAILASSQIIATKNKIYLLGGYIGGSTWTGTIYSASLSSDINDYSPYYDGTIGPAITEITNYMMPGSGKPWQQQYQINQSQGVDITGWTTEPGLPTGILSGQTVVTKNRVYLFGGSNSGGENTVSYTAPINTDGTLGTWVTGPNTPINYTVSQAVVTKNRVYMIGGYNATNGYLTTTHTATINSDGTLGTWVTGTSLPVGFAYSQAVVTKNRVYLIGGVTTGSAWVGSVYSASFDNNGVIGLWSANTSLPGVLGASHVIVTKNRVYLCGGRTGATRVATVYTAPINADGTIGTWQGDISLPGAVAEGQVLVTKNRVYIMGGYSGSYLSSVYTAPILNDGTLGAWTTGTSLPGILGSSHAVVTKNRVYLISGFTSSVYLTTVYTTTIADGVNDYSPYYDGTIQPAVVINPNGNKFLIPDTTADEPFGSYSYIKF